MEETGELIRPYAVAAFKHAQEEGNLEQWSEMLAALQTIVRDPTAAGLISNPRVDDEELAKLIVDVGGDRFTSSLVNLVRLLVENNKLSLVPELVTAFNEQRSRHEGRSDVRVISAFELTAEQEQRIAEAMGKRLGTEVTLSVSVDRNLIGGVVVRAGDLVIDASLRGRLDQLSQSLI